MPPALSHDLIIVCEVLVCEDLLCSLVSRPSYSTWMMYTSIGGSGYKTRLLY